jgi:glycerophosphoryl diester phosphodiesterase
MSRFSLTSGGRTALLTAHMGRLSGNYRRNSRAAVEECLAAGVPRIEVDIHSLAGPDYIVAHDRRLEDETTGRGGLGHATPEDVRAVTFSDDATARPLLLSELVAMAAASETEVQLDLKDWRPMEPERIQALLETVAPMHDRVIISTGQDWNLQRIHHADPTLALGFDPGHYLDHAVEESPFVLPRALGAYGYRDDHPLALGRSQSTADYLRERMAMLSLHCPTAREFFLYYRMVLQMQDDGFDVIGWLHERGIAATAWTPDYRDGDSVRDLRRLIDAGIDRITTNTIPAWLAAFS